jgi:phenylalanyl-tRNA synthetase beta chain
MKISYEWLKDFIDLSETPEEISEVLTNTGLEVEGLEKVEKVKGGLQGLVVGEVISCEKHPGADKLKLTQVDVGADETLSIVCGAPNVAAGQKVIVAPVNTTIFPSQGEPFKIKKAKIRGERSEGMICAEDEIGLGSNHDGIMVLDTDKPNGYPAADLFDLGEDYIFEIGLTPNRGDAASHLGTARDLKAFYQRDLKSIHAPQWESHDMPGITAQVDNPDACPRYSGLTIRDVKVGPSPEWLQHRLRSIGLEPINNLVDITNFTLHSLGQPLHAFDLKEIKGDHIIVKTLPAGTSFTTLDEKERKLHKDDLMICNAESEGMCIAGVFGGITSGVKDSTTDIFLESAHFGQDSVRQTVMRHGLNTDAGFRFERGTDPEMTMTALAFAGRLIQELAGGKISAQIVDIYPKPVPEARIDTKFSTFDRLMGKNLPHEEIIGILNLLDIVTEDVTAETFTAVVPSYRSEVTREADLVEEVLRIHGINSIEIDESFSTSYLAEFEETEPYKLQESISQYLSGKGYREIFTNSLTNPEYETKLQLGSEAPIEILNKSSEELGIMRTTMIYTGLESLRHNINRKRTNLKFYEFGKTYVDKEGSHIEQSWLSLFLTGMESSETWMQETHEASFTHLYGLTNALFNKCGIQKWEAKPIENDPRFIYGLTYTIGKQVLGTIGKLKAEVLEAFSITQDTFYGELDWELLIQHRKTDITYQQMSRFPEVRRDLSLVIDKHISFKEIEKISFNSEKKLLTRMNVFSVYEGDKIEKGKKSYAIAFYLQDLDKTLNDKQIDKTMSRLMGTFEKELNALIRK